MSCVSDFCLIRPSTIKATTSSGKEREVTPFSSSAKDGWVFIFFFFLFVFSRWLINTNTNLSGPENKSERERKTRSLVCAIEMIIFKTFTRQGPINNFFSPLSLWPDGPSRPDEPHLLCLGRASATISIRKFSQKKKEENQKKKKKKS